MAQIERQQTVLHVLQNLRDLAGLKKLFWEELNYERENEPLSMRGWPDSVRKALGDDPVVKLDNTVWCCYYLQHERRATIIKRAPCHRRRGFR